MNDNTTAVPFLADADMTSLHAMTTWSCNVLSKTRQKPITRIQQTVIARAVSFVRFNTDRLDEKVTAPDGRLLPNPYSVVHGDLTYGEGENKNVEVLAEAIDIALRQRGLGAEQLPLPYTRQGTDERVIAVVAPFLPRQIGDFLSTPKTRHRSVTMTPAVTPPSPPAPENRPFDSATQAGTKFNREKLWKRMVGNEQFMRAFFDEVASLPGFDACVTKALERELLEGD